MEVDQSEKERALQKQSDADGSAKEHAEGQDQAPQPTVEVVKNE